MGTLHDPITLETIECRAQLSLSSSQVSKGMSKERCTPAAMAVDILPEAILSNKYSSLAHSFTSPLKIVLGQERHTPLKGQVQVLARDWEETTPLASRPFCK